MKNIIFASLISFLCIFSLSCVGDFDIGGNFDIPLNITLQFSGDPSFCFQPHEGAKLLSVFIVGTDANGGMLFNQQVNINNDNSLPSFNIDIPSEGIVNITTTVMTAGSCFDCCSGFLLPSSCSGNNGRPEMVDDSVFDAATVGATFTIFMDEITECGCC